MSALAPRGIDSYRQNEIQSRSPLELVVMLYDGALRFTSEARDAMVRGDIRARQQHLSRAMAIVSELQSTLDMETGGEVAEHLDNLYGFVRDRLIDAGPDPEEPFHRAFRVEELTIALVDVARQQRRATGIGARDQDRRDVANISGESRCGQVADRVRGRDQHLSTHVAALFFARQLILQVHARRACLDHRLDQLEDVERPAKTGFGISHNGRKPVDVVFAFAIFASELANAPKTTFSSTTKHCSSLASGVKNATTGKIEFAGSDRDDTAVGLMGI